MVVTFLFDTVLYVPTVGPMEDAHWAYNAGERSPKDGAWFKGYVASVLCTGVMGLVAWHSMCEPIPRTQTGLKCVSGD